MKYSYKVDDNFGAGYVAGSKAAESDSYSGGEGSGYVSSFLGYIFLFLLLPALILWMINDWFFNLWKTLLIPNILFLFLLTWFKANIHYFRVNSPENYYKLRSLNKKINIINIVIGYSVCAVLLPLDFILDFAKVQLDNRGEGFFNDLFHGAIFLFLFYLTNVIQVAAAPIVQMGFMKVFGDKIISRNIQSLLIKLQKGNKLQG